MRSVAERSVVLQHTCFGTGNSANATAGVSDSAFAVLATDNSSRSQPIPAAVPGASTLWISWRIPPDVNSGGTLRNVPPLLSHRSLYAVSFDGYDGYVTFAKVG